MQVFKNSLFEPGAKAPQIPKMKLAVKGTTDSSSRPVFDAPQSANTGKENSTAAALKSLLTDVPQSALCAKVPPTPLGARVSCTPQAKHGVTQLGNGAAARFSSTPKVGGSQQVGGPSMGGAALLADKSVQKPKPRKPSPDASQVTQQQQQQKQRQRRQQQEQPHKVQQRNQPLQSNCNRQQQQKQQQEHLAEVLEQQKQADMQEVETAAVAAAAEAELAAAKQPKPQGGKRKAQKQGPNITVSPSHSPSEQEKTKSQVPSAEQKQNKRIRKQGTAAPAAQSTSLNQWGSACANAAKGQEDEGKLSESDPAQGLPVLDINLATVKEQEAGEEHAPQFENGNAVHSFFKQLEEEVPDLGLDSDDRKKGRGRGRNKQELPLREMLHKSWNGLTYIERLAVKVGDDGPAEVLACEDEEQYKPFAFKCSPGSPAFTVSPVAGISPCSSASPDQPQRSLPTSPLIYTKTSAAATSTYDTSKQQRRQGFSGKPSRLSDRPPQAQLDTQAADFGGGGGDDVEENKAKPKGGRRAVTNAQVAEKGAKPKSGGNAMAFAKLGRKAGSGAVQALVKAGLGRKRGGGTEVALVGAAVGEEAGAVADVALDVEATKLHVRSCTRSVAFSLRPPEVHSAAAAAAEDGSDVQAADDTHRDEPFQTAETAKLTRRANGRFVTSKLSSLPEESPESSLGLVSDRIRVHDDDDDDAHANEQHTASDFNALDKRRKSVRIQAAVTAEATACERDEVAEADFTHAPLNSSRGRSCRVAANTVKESRSCQESANAAAGNATSTSAAAAGKTRLMHAHTGTASAACTDPDLGTKAVQDDCAVLQGGSGAGGEQPVETLCGAATAGRKRKKNMHPGAATTDAAQGVSAVETTLGPCTAAPAGQKRRKSTHPKLGSKANPQSGASLDGGSLMVAGPTADADAVGAEDEPTSPGTSKPQINESQAVIPQDPGWQHSPELRDQLAALHASLDAASKQHASQLEDLTARLDDTERENRDLRAEKKASEKVSKEVDKKLKKQAARDAQEIDALKQELAAAQSALAAEKDGRQCIMANTLKVQQDACKAEIDKLVSTFNANVAETQQNIARWLLPAKM